MTSCLLFRLLGHPVAWSLCCVIASQILIVAAFRSLNCNHVSLTLIVPAFDK